MKMSAVWNLLKKDRLGTIITRPDRQWLQIGGCIYPLDGLGLVTPDMLYTLLDVPEDKRRDYHIYEMDVETVPKYLQDVDETDELAEAASFMVRTAGSVYQMYKAGENLLTINPDTLRPLENEEDVNLYVREYDGGHVMVARSGFLLRAVIGTSTYWARNPLVYEDMQVMAELGKREYDLRYREMDEVTENEKSDHR